MFDFRKFFKRKLLIIFCLITAVPTLEAQKRPLTEYGSDKPAYTIFTQPGQDCSTTMNISWATPPGKKWEIELTDESDGSVYVYDYDDSFTDEKITCDSLVDGKIYKFPFVYRCETFNNIPSRLSDRSNVIEKHIFDKHGYELYDLEPDRDYSYRIVTYDDDPNNKEHSEIHRFHTAGASQWKAAIIGDFHHYSPSPHRLRSAMGMLDVLDSVSGGYDWVISTGDQCAWGGSYNFWTELAEQPQYQNKMWAAVQGNHDHMASDKRTSDNFFRDSNFFPQNGYRGQEGIAYWFKYGDVLFLMLNNEAMYQEGGLQPAIDWMEKTVAENSSKYIVVVEHYQWIIGTSGTTGQLDKFYKTFDKLGVDLAISGHNHVYLRTSPLKDRVPVAPEEGTVYVVNSSSDNERGREMKKLKANEKIIEKRWSEGPQTVGAMLMDVNPERIEINFYNRFGKVQDSFTVPAKR